MPRRKFSAGKVIILLVAVVFLSGIGTLALVGKRIAPSPYDCRTRTLRTLDHLAGANFTVSHTRCQDYTHKQFVSVYVQRFVAPGAPFYDHWFNKPALLFRYHPESDAGPLPVLSQTASDAVRISVSRVARIDEERQRWLGLTIQYRIGRNDHPVIPSRR